VKQLQLIFLLFSFLEIIFLLIITDLFFNSAPCIGKKFYSR
jgi:hypothetical protein